MDFHLKGRNPVRLGNACQTGRRERSSEDVRRTSDTRVIGGFLQEPKSFLTQGALPFSLQDLTDPADFLQHPPSVDSAEPAPSDEVSEVTSQGGSADQPPDDMFPDDEDMVDLEDPDVSGMSCYSSMSTLDCADLAMIESDPVTSQVDMVVCPAEPSDNPPHYFHIRRDGQLLSRMDSLRLSEDD